MWPQQLRAVTATTRHLPSVPYGAEYSPHREQIFFSSGSKMYFKMDPGTESWERHTQVSFLFLHDWNHCHLLGNEAYYPGSRHFHTYFLISMSSFNVDVKVQSLQMFGSKLFLWNVHTLRPRTTSIYYLSLLTGLQSKKLVGSSQGQSCVSLVYGRKLLSLEGTSITQTHHTSLTQRRPDPRHFCSEETLLATAWKWSQVPGTINRIN